MPESHLNKHLPGVLCPHRAGPRHRRGTESRHGHPKSGGSRGKHGRGSRTHHHEEASLKRTLTPGDASTSSSEAVTSHLPEGPQPDRLPLQECGGKSRRPRVSPQ